MKLADLPPELLSIVTAYLHYLDVSNLSMSGFARLNRKLSAGGISELTVRFASNLRTFVWPTLFHLTRLTRLVIHDSYVGTTPLINTTMLAKVAQTVKDLKINCPGAFPALQEILLRYPGSFPALESLELTISYGEVTDSDAARWPQSLTNLALTTSSTRHLNLDPATLPPHLTHLSGDFCKVVNPSNVAFPETLTALQVRIGRLVCDPIPLLPAGLKSLSISTLDFTDVPDGDRVPRAPEVEAWAKRSICKLPRGLTSLSWPLNAYNREALQALPVTLTMLKGATVQPADMEAMPAALVYAFACSTSSSPLKKNMIQHLPSSFEHVVVEPRALPYLNPSSNIRVDVIGMNVGLQKEMDSLKVESLSPHITSLKLQFSYDLPWKTLPSKLTSLTIDKGSLTTDNVCLLPHTLKELVMARGDLWEDIEVLKRLLPQLETLSIHTVPALSPESSTWLPCTLQDLTITKCPKIPLEWFAGLPKGLRSLRVPVDMKSTPSTLPLPPTDSSSGFSLPPTLANLTLEVTFPNPKKAARTAMQIILASLPAKLEKLCVSHKPDNISIPYATSDLELLPKRLLSVEMPYSAELDTKTTASLLPYSLQSASFGSRCFFAHSEKTGKIRLCSYDSD